MRRKWFTKAVALTCAVSMLLTSCGSAGSNSTADTAGQETSSGEVISAETAESDAEPVYGGELKVAVGTVTSLDPQFESADEPMSRHIFETVLSLDEKGNAQTGVCSYEVSDDYLTITLTVRDGVTFHDGNPVTADDVAASLRRWTTNISNGVSYVGQYLAEENGIEVVDEKTIALHFTTVASAAPQSLGYEYMGAFVLPAAVCEAYPDSAVTDTAMLVGTGPYKFDEWVADSYVRVSRYDGYVGTGNTCEGPAGEKKAYADTITFYIATDADARVNGVLTGEYDLTRNVSYSTYESLKEDPSVKFYMIDDGTKPAVVFDKSEGVTADPLFRQAVLSCIDMEAVMLAAFGSEELFTLTGSWTPFGSFYECDNDLYNAYDVEKAKELLAQSSYNGETVVYITSQDVAYYYTTAMMVTQMMEAIGITVDLQVMDQATLYTVRQEPASYDMFAVGFTAKVDPTMMAFFGDTWPGLWVSEEKTTILDGMAATMDADERLALWQEMTALLYTDVPVITFGERKNCTLTTKRVMNATYALSEPYYWNIWLAE